MSFLCAETEHFKLLQITQSNMEKTLKRDISKIILNAQRLYTMEPQAAYMVHNAE